MDHSPVFKQVTLENLEAEHICCCISDKKGENCVSSKKSWLRNRGLCSTSWMYGERCS